MDEETFRQALVKERKRIDRSKESLLLVLLEVSQIAATASGPAIMEKMKAAFALAVRETDFSGWHSEGKKYGVVFTQLSRNDLLGHRKILLGKVRSALENSLGPALASQIGIESVCYPEFVESPEAEPHPEIYPDVMEDSNPRSFRRVGKRLLDIVGSLAAMTLLSPIFLVVAALIKLTSRGPVLYRQTRIGQFGKPFTFLKFRSMHVNADPEVHKKFVLDFIEGQKPNGNGHSGGAAVYKLNGDPRVTSVGGFIRKTSLDELPQFYNVLIGNMSLVGPRPPIPYELVKYESWHRRRVLEARPGITGLWQVYGRSRTSFDEMVRLDLQYIQRQSFWLDLKILLMTPLAVASGKGAR